MSDCFAKFPIDDNTMFSINVDGTYSLTTLVIDKAIQEAETQKSDFSYILQCYSNGYANKVGLHNMLTLRRNYTFSHGLYPTASLLYCRACSESDFVIALFDKSGSQYLSIIPICTLTSHSMLGLKGDKIVKTTFDAVINYYLLANDVSGNISGLISYCSRNGYVGLDEPSASEELRWLNENIIKQNIGLSLRQTAPVSVNSINNADDLESSYLMGLVNLDSIRERFNGYLKKGRDIPVGQRQVKDVLSLCHNKEDFWNTIKCLLECSTAVYRSPIVAYLRSQTTIYTPDLSILTPIVYLLFSTNEKIERSLDFLYPFRAILSKDILSFIQSKITTLSTPEDYHTYGEIFKYSQEDLIDYCLENPSPASYYCIYEILQDIKKKGLFSTTKLAKVVRGKLDDTLIEGKLIREFITNDFISSRKLNADLIIIKNGGYKEFIKACRTFEEKKKHQMAVDNITSLVGKRIGAKLCATYQNHYFLLTNQGIRILLPKKLKTEDISDGSMLNVFIALADKAYDTLLATQKLPVDYRIINQIPLLNSGDVIEVTFNINGKPEPHKCYKKIRLSVDSYPKTFDNRARYQAKVLRQTSDKYHYLVKLLKQV